jgi:predicted negative regulator of RcsB-dependent stress response
MAAKLSKKELEGPDIFQTSIEKVTDFISENKIRFYVIVTAIVLAIIIALGIYFYWTNYQTSAVELYAQAQNNLTKNADKPQAVKETIDMFKKLIDKYPQSWSAKIAHYQLGNIYYNQGEIDNAISSYNNYVKSSVMDNAGIRFLALTSLGYCYETKKDYKSALRYFEEAQKSNNTGFEAIAYRNIARIYEQMDNKAKALENYKNALQKTTDPSMSIFIKRKISSLS